MKGKAVGSILMVLAGLAAAWAGFAWWASALTDSPLPIRTLSLLAAAGLVTIGTWLCWQGAALLLRPPAPASRLISVLAAGALGALAVTALFVAIQDLGVS
jgi:hypothetical protein